MPLTLIVVHGLTRHYDGRAALVDLTFSVPRGQVLGLLGRAGAGKSTAMRILAGCLSPTSGAASIAGCDVLRRSREARRHLGYLPETAPLCDEMRVQPYLETMCRLRGVPPSARRAQVDGALAACRLDDRRREIIGRLSRGLRRRVGLAQAVVHDPDALVLDEPTAGLDAGPAQEMRELVAEVCQGRAVVLSGRVLSDVSRICDRVLVIEDGRTVADDTPVNLGRRHQERRSREVLAVVGGDPAPAERHLRALAGVAEVALAELGDGDHRLTVTGERADLQDAVARVIVERGFRLKELSSREATREDDVLIDLVTEEDA